MPIAFDTNEIFRYVISTDRSKPVEQQPTLLFHYPTCKETRMIANKFDAANKAASVDEMIQLQIDAIKIILCGGENLQDRNGPVAYDPSKLDDVLTNNDLIELEARLLKDMSASEIDKKKAALLPPSKLESSATNAKVAA